jgi:hypothetical protein
MRDLKYYEKRAYIFLSSYPIFPPLLLCLFYLHITYVLGRFPEIMLDDPKNFGISNFYMPIIDGLFLGLFFFLLFWIPITIYLLIFERKEFKKALIISIILQFLGVIFLYSSLSSEIFPWYIEILTWYLD